MNFHFIDCTRAFVASINLAYKLFSPRYIRVLSTRYQCYRHSWMYNISNINIVCIHKFLTLFFQLSGTFKKKKKKETFKRFQPRKFQKTPPPYDFLTRFQPRTFIKAYNLKSAREKKRSVGISRGGLKITGSRLRNIEGKGGGAPVRAILAEDYVELNPWTGACPRNT